MNQHAQTVFEALTSAPSADALGLIPEAYQDIKFIAPLLQEQRLLNEAERMRTLLGPSGDDVTQEKLGVTKSIYGDGSVRYDAVDMVNRYADAGASLGYPSDMPRQLQEGLYADNVAKMAVVAYLASIGSPEGAGQIVALNRWAYDITGSNKAYVRPDVLVDLGIRERFWIDGKSTFINNGVVPRQLLDFFQFTGSQTGTVVTGQGNVINIKPPRGGKKGP